MQEGRGAGPACRREEEQGRAVYRREGYVPCTVLYYPARHPVVGAPPVYSTGTAWPACVLSMPDSVCFDTFDGPPV